jgi:hypothetical protein
MSYGVHAEGKEKDNADLEISIHRHLFSKVSLSFWILSFCMHSSFSLVANTDPMLHSTNVERCSTSELAIAPSFFNWIELFPDPSYGACLSETDCCEDIICYGLEYTPGASGIITSYTTGFFTECLSGMTPLVSNASCTMIDNSFQINECMSTDSILFNCSAYDSLNFLAVTMGEPVILHQVCFRLVPGQSINISEDHITDLSVGLDQGGGIYVDEFPMYTNTVITRPLQTWPADQSTTVACINAAIEPDVPDVFDQCGNLIDVELISINNFPSTITCEGFKVYVYEYTDCAGLTHLWNYYYFIEYLPFTVPADGGEIVTCINDIDVNLLDPPIVNDNCGIPLTPSGPSGPVYDPLLLTCDGTVTYTWTYADCEGNTMTWDYVYSVEQSSPIEMGGPVQNSSTISCGLQGTAPLALPMVVDACGNTVPAPAPVIGGTYTGGCDGTITYSYTYSNCPGNEFIWVYTYTVECSPLQVKVLLEGPYNTITNTMIPHLNVNHVLPGQDKLLSPFESVQDNGLYTPFGQPYTIAPWNYYGNLGLQYGDASSPGAPMVVIPYPVDVVDWVLVTIRENGILPTDNIWTCAGWVHTDGSVTFPESCGTLNFDILDDYYIVIQHRNHLGIMSPIAAEMPCGNSYIEWDFTTADSYEVFPRVGQKEIEPDVWVMFAADGDQIASLGAISSHDRTKWINLQNILGYSVGDYNMDVSVSSLDETVWKLNQNSTSAVIFYY